MYNVYGVYASSYEEACMIAGADSPASLAEEDRYRAMEDEVYSLSQPVGCIWCSPVELPF